MAYRIGEVAAKTGISEHALRQWSKRYGIEASAISPGGQRLYTDEDIARLHLIAAGKRKGILLTELSVMPTETLAVLVKKKDSAPLFAWYGEHRAYFHAHFPSIQWVDHQLARTQSHGVFIVVCETITEDVLEQILPCSCRLEVFTRFVSRPSRRRMEQQGNCHFHNEKPTDAWLQRLVMSVSGERLFTAEALEAYQNLSPQLDCECPTHLAAILKDLRNFAQYSLNCEVKSPEEAWLHRRTYTHTQQAQLAVEDALRLVIDHEGLSV